MNTMMIIALMTAPLASMAHMLLTMLTLQMRYTPNVAQKKTSALWNIERLEAFAASLMASILSLPLLSSSLYLEVINIA